MPASEPKNKSLFAKIISAIFPQTSTTNSNQQSSFDQTSNNINEDSKGDFLALDEPDLIFSEEE